MQLPFWLQSTRASLAQQTSLRGHAFLLLGIAGLGQEALAKAIAQDWLGHAMNDDPDICIIEALEGKRDIGVEQIRALTAWAQQTAHGKRGRVVIVHQIERMTTAAANSLLKTLEEPPEGVRFLMTAQRAGKLLPTILSRCQRVVLSPPSLDEGVVWLRQSVNDVSEQEAKLALQLHAGAPIAAQTWLLSSGLSEWREWQQLWQDCLHKQEVSQALAQWARSDVTRLCRLLAAQSYLTGQAFDTVLPWQMLRLVWQVEKALTQNISKDLLVDNLLLAVNRFLVGEMPNMKLVEKRGALA
ncbi:MAG: AAA family ATPase [Thiotrichales bacterium]|jgi:DNA polymerase-3 subunit delta'|nr:AAA family ATPase [Thiotrichales bacterium]